jgi:Sigma-70, region 4
VAPWNDAGWYEHRVVFHEEIDRLPQKDRAAIILCDLEGRSPGDVARELRCSVGRLEQRLVTARARLQARMAARGCTIPGGRGVTELSRDAESMVPERLVESTVEAVIRRQSRPEPQATVRDDPTEPGERVSQTPDRGGPPGSHPRDAAGAPLLM